MARVLIVYSARTKVPRRVFVQEPHEPDIDVANFTLFPGEAYLLRDELTHPARHIVAAHHNIDIADIPSGRCAVVDDTGTVLAVVMADPEIDAHPHGRLIASDTLSVGDKA